jgi:hypothetical protein
MRVTLEFTAESFKENLGKTIEELFVAKGSKKPTTKKPIKKDEDDEDEEADEEAEEDEEADEEADDEESDIDADMIKETISAAVKAGNKVKVEALFKEFKAKTVSGLKEAQYVKFYTKLKPLAKKKK